MGRVLAFLYGVVCYAFFFVVFLYAIGFVENLVVPKAIDTGEAGALVPTLLIDAALLGVFAIQHSVMARPAFKAWWTKIVPAPVELSTYVLFASAALVLVFWQWRPLPQVLWSLQGGAATAVLTISLVGFLIVLTSTFLINHFDLFGLRQVHAYATGKEIPPPEFTTPLFYRFVRHPLYLGFIIAFWAAPVMTVGHLLFAGATTAYMLIAIQLEEHDLIGIFGDRYRLYRQQAGMLWPKFGSAPKQPG